MKQQTNEIYEFGPFRLDQQERLLQRDGTTISLTPKAFDLLLVLIEQHGHLLEKDELLRQVWPDSFVEEANLASNISQLRKALGEGENGQKYIETVPKRGYRFVAQVRESPRGEEAPPESVVQGMIEESPKSQESLVAATDKAGSSALIGKALLSKRRRAIVFATGGLATAALAFGFFRFYGRFYGQKQSATRSDARARRRVPRDGGMATGAVWSPDGKFIAYTSLGPGDCGIWLHPFDRSGNPIRVTEEPVREVMMDWSPDGRKLLFLSSQQGGGIFVRPAFGGPAQKIAPFAFLARWSADGAKIMILTHSQWFIPLRARIYLVNPDGSELQEFRPDFLREFSRIIWAIWHPDGKRITINGTHPKLGSGLWTIPINGGAPIKSERTPEMEDRTKAPITTVLNHEWSPSGEHLYVTALSKTGWNIWRVTVDPQTLRWVDGPQQLTAGPYEDVLGRVSPDGKKLAYEQLIGAEHIWDVPFDAANGQLRGAEKLIADTAYVFEMSADGRKLIYSIRDELREYSFDTSKPKVLASLEKYTYGIGAWAADGSRVALRRSLRITPGSNRTPEAQYVWLAAGGGEEHPITSPVDPRTAPGRLTDWSRDDQWLLEVANASQAGKSVIRLLPLAAAPQAETQAKEVTSSPERSLDNARFSPDGRWVAFNAWHPQEGKEGTIYVVPVGGGDWIPITDGKEWFWNNRPRWSPDGKIIYYISSPALTSGVGVNVWGRRFDPVTGQPVGEAFRVTNYESLCTSRKDIILKNSGFGVAQNRLALPLLDVYDHNLWVLEDVDK